VSDSERNDWGSILAPGPFCSEHFREELKVYLKRSNPASRSDRTTEDRPSGSGSILVSGLVHDDLVMAPLVAV